MARWAGNDQEGRCLLTNAELMLLAAVYGVYFLDCVVWLKPGQTALTRTAEGWRTHTAERLGFTLAGRQPLVVDPLLLRPGLIRLVGAPSPRILKRVQRRLDRYWMLLLCCRAQAVLLLVYLPLLVWMHRLVAVWPFFLGVLVLLHVLICVLAARALRMAGEAKRGTMVASLAFNPVGATRVFGVLTQAVYERVVKG